MRRTQFFAPRLSNNVERMIGVDHCRPDRVDSCCASSNAGIENGSVAKWLRQRIANPPSWVQLPPEPLNRKPRFSLIIQRKAGFFRSRSAPNKITFWIGAMHVLLSRFLSCQFLSPRISRMIFEATMDKEYGLVCGLLGHRLEAVYLPWIKVASPAKTIDAMHVLFEPR